MPVKSGNDVVGSAMSGRIAVTGVVPGVDGESGPSSPGAATTAKHGRASMRTENGPHSPPRLRRGLPCPDTIRGTVGTLVNGDRDHAVFTRRDETRCNVLTVQCAHGRRRDVADRRRAGDGFPRFPVGVTLSAVTGRHTHSVLDSIERFALSLPDVWADSPWGDRVVKVGRKIFLFVSDPAADRPVMTTKLPESRDHALSYPEAFPTRYGLGKHGWVTLYVDTVPDDEAEVLIDFVEESYRAVATKTLVKRLDAEIAAQQD